MNIVSEKNSMEQMPVGVGQFDQESKEKEDLKEKSLEILQEIGMLEYRDSIPVLDLERFTSETISKKVFVSKGVEFEKRDRNVYKIFFESLAELPVVSKADYEVAVSNLESIPEPTPLFNVPSSIEEAFDVENIKNKQYHLNYWDQYRKPGRQNIPQKWQYKIKTQDKKEIGAKEMAIATEIFRNNKGYRDEAGNLMVFDFNKDEFVKITGRWFKNNIGNIGEGRESFDQNPVPILQFECQNLLRSDLVKTTDFRIASGKGGSKLIRKELSLNSFARGEISLEDVRYNLGNKLLQKLTLIKNVPKDNLEVSILEKGKLAGIIVKNGDRREVKYVINLLSEEEKANKRLDIEEKKGTTGFKTTQWMYLTQKETMNRIHAWDITKDHPKKNNESAEEYVQRMRAITSYDFIQEMTEKIISNSGASIHNLTWKEQQWLAAAAYNLSFLNKTEKLYSFAKKYKLQGLKAFLSLEQGGQEIGDKILLIGEKLETKDADLIFAQYAKIVDATENVRQELETQFEGQEVSDEDVREISETILVKAACLLTNFANKLEAGEELDSNDIVSELENYNEDLLFTFSIFKKYRGKLEDLKGVNFESNSVGKYADIHAEIDQMSRGEYELKDNDSEEVKEVYQMFELYRQNYAGRDEFQKTLLVGFAKALKGKDEKTKLYMVKQNDKVVAFNRYDDLGDGKKYFGSCNVMPSAQALAVGGSVFSESLEQEKSGSEIAATVDAFSPISSLYIEKGNFHVESVDIESDPDGTPWFVLKRESDNNRSSYYEDKDDATLIQELIHQEGDFPDNAEHFVILFDNSKKQKQKIIQLINEKGFKITRSVLDKQTKKTYLGLEK